MLSPTTEQLRQVLVFTNDPSRHSMVDRPSAAHSPFPSAADAHASPTVLRLMSHFTTSDAREHPLGPRQGSAVHLLTRHSSAVDVSAHTKPVVLHESPAFGDPHAVSINDVANDKTNEVGRMWGGERRQLSARPSRESNIRRQGFSEKAPQVATDHLLDDPNREASVDQGLGHFRQVSHVAHAARQGNHAVKV
jgi:hypothetical protein